MMYTNRLPSPYWGWRRHQLRHRKVPEMPQLLRIVSTICNRENGRGAKTFITASEGSPAYVQRHPLIRRSVAGRKPDPTRTSDTSQSELRLSQLGIRRPRRATTGGVERCGRTARGCANQDD